MNVVLYPSSLILFHILGNLEALANLNTSQQTDDVLNTDLPSPKCDNGESQESSTSKRRSKLELCAYEGRAGNSFLCFN